MSVLKIDSKPLYRLKLEQQKLLFSTCKLHNVFNLCFLNELRWQNQWADASRLVEKTQLGHKRCFCPGRVSNQNLFKIYRSGLVRSRTERITQTRNVLFYLWKTLWPPQFWSFTYLNFHTESIWYVVNLQKGRLLENLIPRKHKSISFDSFGTIEKWFMEEIMCNSYVACNTFHFAFKQDCLSLCRKTIRH